MARRISSSLLCLCLLTGCTGLPLADIWREGSPLDYAKLVTCAHQLLSEDRRENFLGLGVPESRVDQVVMWWNATMLALKAGKAILSRTDTFTFQISNN
jgi:hypothetical protein